MTMHVARAVWVRCPRWLALASIVVALGCADAGDESDSEQPELVSVQQALDNEPGSDPDDGKTCYVDGPLAGQGKGKMDKGFCCVKRKDNETCYQCTEAYWCQIANGGPACLTIDPNIGATVFVKPSVSVGAIKAATTNIARTME